MGEVYLAHDTKLDRQVAIKLLPDTVRYDAVLRERFFQEARSASALNHPNVCTIYELGDQDPAQPYICMEFVDGETLESKLKRETTLPLEEACEIISQVAQALQAAFSSGIVHRDLKPGNISINHDGIVKILDFGLAKRLTDQPAMDDATIDYSLTNTGGIMGTPSYMSPEQALGGDIDHRTDLFSLGVVFFEMVSGQRPFSGKSLGDTINNIINSPPPSLAALNPNTNGALQAIVLRCLQKSPNDRYASPEELTADLEAYMRGDITSSQTRFISDGSPAESDVYISYSALDDQSLSGVEEGWISRFHRNLKVRLQQLAGREVNVFRPNKMTSEKQLDENTIQDIPKVNSLLTIVSPPFANSDSCKQEVDSFVAGKANADSKVIKVVKLPVDSNSLANDVLKRINDHNFFDQDERGRILEYEEAFGEDLKRRYYEKIYDVAYDLNKTLNTTYDDTLASEIDAPKAFVAITTSDVRSEYESVCRELTERGYVVVPDKPLTFEALELAEEVNAHLENAELMVQVVGKNYGIVPEGAQQSLLELQSASIRTLMESDEAERQQFIWYSSPDCDDDRQAGFIESIRSTDAAHHRCELIEGPISLLKEAISQHLDSLTEKPVESPEQPKGTTQIYLICDSLDEDATEPLEDYLFQSGMEVILPDFDSPQEEISEIHRQALTDCDAVLIYYGQVRKAWVDIKLRDTLKAAGYGRENSLNHVAVYIAPPTDKRKERFKTHQAEIIQQPQETFEVTPELTEFINKAVTTND